MSKTLIKSNGIFLMFLYWKKLFNNLKHNIQSFDRSEKSLKGIPTQKCQMNICMRKEGEILPICLRQIFQVVRLRHTMNKPMKCRGVDVITIENLHLLSSSFHWSGSNWMGLLEIIGSAICLKEKKVPNLKN